jgi:hypothetical protein
MTMPALASSPRMVGRDAELKTLLDAFEEGRRGIARTVVVRGEAGIGKTRLVQEFLSALPRDEDPPVIVAVGQCVDLGPIGAPFGPIRRVLRDLHAAIGSDALREAAGSAAAASILAAFVPGIADAEPADEEQVGEFAEVMEVVLRSLSARWHVVVVVEDLQWADAATLGLLRTLASTLRAQQLTVVATYRSDDIDRFHPLRPVLAELDRTRAVVRVEVSRLSADEVAEQVRLIVPYGLADGELEMLSERSGGIPFLVEELVDLGDAPLPETLRDLVLARYLRLSDPAQEVMRVMAAGGIHTDDQVLRAVSTLDEHDLDVALREAIEARVVVAEGAGYSFRHALTQEAVYGEMLPSERVRVHRRYAEHLAEHRADSPDAVSAVAEHWLIARELTAAFDATVLALQQSRATFAPATSVKLAERLTELWGQVPDAEARSGTTLAELHLDAAQWWHDLGDPERALRSASEGLAVSPDDPLILAALLRQRFVHEFNTGKKPDGSDLREAMRLLEGVSGERARVLMSRILINLVGEDDAEGGGQLDRAIEIAEETGDETALAVALTNKSSLLSDAQDDEPAALGPVERALSLRINPATRTYAGEVYVSLLSRLGRFQEAADVGEQLYAEAARAGIERGTAAGMAVSTVHALFAAGDAETALRYAARTRRTLDPSIRVDLARVLATHYAWNDQPDARRDLLDAERSILEEHARRHPRSAEWWDETSVDAVCASAAGLPHSSTDLDWRPTVAALAHRLERKGSPASRRYAAVAAALVLKAIGSAPVDGADDLRRHVDSALVRWGGTGVQPVVAAFVRALLADPDGATAASRVDAWRQVVDATAVGVMPVRHRQLARLARAAALV